MGSLCRLLLDPLSQKSYRAHGTLSKQYVYDSLWPLAGELKPLPQMVQIVSGYWLVGTDATRFVDAVYPDDEERPAGGYMDPVVVGYGIARIAKWLVSVRERERTVGFTCEYTIVQRG